jgi:hypothetical protein
MPGSCCRRWCAWFREGRYTVGRHLLVGHNIQEWKYTDSVSEARRKSLAEPGSYEALVDLVIADVRDIRARSQKGTDRGLTDCIQPIFSFELPNTGDALFNGPWGYRAQYWESPGQGLAANCMLLALLAPKLLGALDTKAIPELGKIDVCASLHTASAKIWIQEIPSLLIHPTSDLDVERWVLAARDNVQLARWGLCAPEAKKFEVKGALMSPYGNEVVPCRKVRRHYDIHHYGFS